jgi:hypothetical protein
MIPYILYTRGWGGYKEAMRALRFRYARGLKNFSLRTQRLSSGRNNCPDKRGHIQSLLTAANIL